VDTSATGSLPEASSGSGLPQRPTFLTAHWSVVLSAQNSDSPHSAEALAKLWNDYWFPLYAFVRRQAHSPHDAQDLTEELFARVTENLAGPTVNER